MQGLKLYFNSKLTSTKNSQKLLKNAKIVIVTHKEFSPNTHLTRIKQTLTLTHEWKILKCFHAILNYTKPKFNNT